MIRRTLLAVLAPALVLTLALPTASGMGKRPKKNQLTFHIESDVSDGPKMVFPLQMGNKKRFFQKTPVTFNREITSLKHFPAEDGTYGATFTFSKAARTRIAAFTNQNQGKWIVAMLNGRAVDGVYIDAAVTDGRLVIWQGIKQVEIIRFEYALPLTGENQKEWKKRIKGHNKQRKEAIKAAKEAQKERNRRKS